MKKVCLVDLDGVLVDLLPAWLRLYGEVTGEWVHPDSVTAYSFEQFIRHSAPFYACLEGALERAAPAVGSSAFRDLYTNPEFDVYVVTYAHAAAPAATRIKLEWLAHYFPDFDRDRVVFTKHKHLVRGDMLIEDCEENLRAWKKANPQGVGYLVKQTYNGGQWAVNEIIGFITKENYK